MANVEKVLCKTLSTDWFGFMKDSKIEYDLNFLKKNIEYLYQVYGYKTPKILIAESPFDAQVIANELIGNSTFIVYPFAYNIPPHNNLTWKAFIHMSSALGNIRYTYKEYMQAGMYSILYFEHAAIFFRKPIIKMEKRMLHSSDSPAISWGDGFGVFYLNGVNVPGELVMSSPEQIDPQLVLRTKNAEIRREIVRKIGAERLVQKLNGITVDVMGDYKLVTIPIPEMSVVPTYLVMRNPSIGVFHVEGVHPRCTTVQEALAWRDGEIDYVPPMQLT